MKLSICVFILFAAIATAAQSPESPLATAKNHIFTGADLSPDAQKAWETRREQLDTLRTQLLQRMINDRLIAIEAKAVAKSSDDLLREQLGKVPDPPAAQVNAVYEANKAALASLTPEKARAEIVAYLKREPEAAAVQKYVDELKAKYKATLVKDVNSMGRPTDVLAAIGTEKITRADFDSENRLRLSDLDHEIYESVRADLELSILDKLVADEAKERKIDASAVIATEVTDKMRTFATGEREKLESDLMKRLFAKYAVKLLLKEPEYISQQIAINDAATRGPIAAPVKVVMFSDFQCPACSRTDPILEQVLASYGEKIRFIVRNYPLQSIHENAFAAALAGEAARLQGKFFEYTAILYRNQDALDAASLKKYAAEAGLNVKQFEIDLSLERTADKIRADIADGDKYGVGGTPTIFVNGVKVYGLSAEAFQRAIDRALVEKR